LDESTKSCVYDCPTGSYANIVNNECTKCSADCTTCSGPNTTDCLSCTLPLYYQVKTNTCTNSCSTGYFMSATSNPVCLSCDSTCLTCSGASNSECLSCSGSLFFNTSTKICDIDCPTNQYRNSSNNICTACDSTCTTCTGGSSSECLSCILPNYYQSTTHSCVSTCS